MINFATLQALDIPEGKVVEIKDAAGRVIWSAIESEPIILYLRPSADISLGHPVYPNTLSFGYLAINEEVSDGSSTYIGYTSSSSGTTSATSSFAMTLQGAHKIASVISAKFIWRGTLSGNSNEQAGSTRAYLDCNVSVLGENVFNCSEERTSSISSLTIDMPNLVNALNNYIGVNGIGSFPEITLEITNSIYHNNKAGTSYTTQVAIELECK